MKTEGFTWFKHETLLFNPMNDRNGCVPKLWIYSWFGDQFYDDYLVELGVSHVHTHEVSDIPFQKKPMTGFVGIDWTVFKYPLVN
jgi:hypothetical protein